MKSQKDLLPSDFMSVYPWDSVTQKSENESLACSIMATKNFKGNTWDDVSYEDYLEYRLSIGAQRGNARQDEFDKVNKYCKNISTAALFSKSWEDIINEFLY